MEFDESIYNLIPKDQYVPEKGRRYKSKYPAKMAPTASTFGLATTSKSKSSNLNGEYDLNGGSHMHKANGATFGGKQGAAKPDATLFKKKQSGQPILCEKKQVSKFNRNTSYVKPGVPKKDEKPIHGLVSDKNFIVANAVENILAAPKLPVTKDKDMLKKKNYG